MNSSRIIWDLKLMKTRLVASTCAVRHVYKGKDLERVWKKIQIRKMHSAKSHILDISTSDKVQRLFRGITENHRSALAEGITLVESSHPSRKREAVSLLTMVLEHLRVRQATENSFRIGISGPPGAGKSTFIEAFGKALTDNDHRVAVLAVDPSSSTTGGSLLGDKTRMPQLTRDPSAYVRPSPTRGKLGGITQNTGDAIVLCEGAGYDRIIVETVGVGQCEVAVGDTVDLFVLVIPPASGDELQGIKRGVMEHSDLIVITKSDGDLEPAAKRVQAEYTSAMKFVRTKFNFWQPKVLRVSATVGNGMLEFYNVVDHFRERALTSGELIKNRRQQNSNQMWNHIVDNLLEALRTNSQICDLAKEYEHQVMGGIIPPSAAAHKLMTEFLQKVSI